MLWHKVQGAGGLVGTEPYTLSNPTFVQTKSFTGTVNDFDFDPTGTTLFVVHAISGVDYLEEYSLSTAWDIGTASVTTSVNVDTTVDFATGVAFNSNGSKVYLVGGGADRLYSYDLSTAYTLSTRTNFDIGVSTDEPRGLHYAEPSGVPTLFKIDFTNDQAEKVTISGGDVDNGSLAQSFTLSQTVPRGIALSPDGSKMLVSDNATDAVYQYDLSSGFDLSTASASGLSLNTATNGETGPWGVGFGDSGTKLYVSGFVNGITQYDLV